MVGKSLQCNRAGDHRSSMITTNGRAQSTTQLLKNTARFRDRSDLKRLSTCSAWQSLCLQRWSCGTHARTAFKQRMVFSIVGPYAWTSLPAQHWWWNEARLQRRAPKLLQAGLVSSSSRGVFVTRACRKNTSYVRIFIKSKFILIKTFLWHLRSIWQFERIST